MNGLHLLGIFLVAVPGLLLAAWYWATYGLNEFLAAVLAIAVMVGLTMGGLALIDARKPPQTIPRGLT